MTLERLSMAFKKLLEITYRAINEQAEQNLHFQLDKQECIEPVDRVKHFTELNYLVAQLPMIDSSISYHQKKSMVFRSLSESLSVLPIGASSQQKMFIETLVHLIITEIDW